MFLVLSVCLSTGGEGPHVTTTHEVPLPGFLIIWGPQLTLPPSLTYDSVQAHKSIIMRTLALRLKSFLVFTLFSNISSDSSSRKFNWYGSLHIPLLQNRSCPNEAVNTVCLRISHCQSVS